MVINDPNELIVVMQKALDRTTDVLLGQLLKLIETTVYSYHSTWINGYDGDIGRTREFYDSWESSKSTIRGNILESEIFQNYLAMRYIDPFSHGSRYSSQPGALQEGALAKIINEGLAPSFRNFPNMEARPFWDEFQTFVNENLDRIFVTQCRVLGLDVKQGFISAL